MAHKADQGAADQGAADQGAAPTDPDLKWRDYSRTLAGRLLRARESVMAMIRPMLRAHDLTEQQWRVLRTLEEQVEVDITRLARIVFLSPPSLTRILQGLVERGLVQRRSSSSDLRRAMVSVTPQGMILVEEVRPLGARIQTEIEEAFGAERLDQLLAMLADLEATLSKRAASPVGTDMET